jgi:hypothetical protein
MAPSSLSPRPPTANVQKVPCVDLKAQLCSCVDLHSLCCLSSATHAQYKVALCQLPVSPDKYENIARARALIDAAAAAGAKLVVLPASLLAFLCVAFTVSLC